LEFNQSEETKPILILLFDLQFINKMD